MQHYAPRVCGAALSGQCYQLYALQKRLGLVHIYSRLRRIEKRTLRLSIDKLAANAFNEINEIFNRRESGSQDNLTKNMYCFERGFP